MTHPTFEDGTRAQVARDGDEPMVHPVFPHDGVPTVVSGFASRREAESFLGFGDLEPGTLSDPSFEMFTGSRLTWTRLEQVHRSHK